MNIQVLIDAVLQQSTVFIAQLATTGGARAPLAHMVDQVFVELSTELQAQGVKKKLIADMFGMTLRTYHRRVRELTGSATYRDRTVWKAVLDYIREHEPVSRARISERFVRDDAEVVIGVLTDLVQTGVCYSSGRGDSTVYRVAEAADFLQGDEDQRQASRQHLVWLHVYRGGPLSVEHIAKAATLEEKDVGEALAVLEAEGLVQCDSSIAPAVYSCERFDVPVGNTNGWEAAVLDHYQAVVAAIISKLRQGQRSSHDKDVSGGATFSFDIGPDHPLRDEATSLLRQVREQANELRDRIDAYNKKYGPPPELEQVIFYVGQFLKADDPTP